MTNRKKRTIITEDKMKRAYRNGLDVGCSKNPNINRCRYNNFQLREKWFQGFRASKNK